MIYEFRAADGEVIELDYPMGKAPTEGEPITVEGKVYRRIVSLSPARFATHVNADLRFEALNFPPNYEFHVGEFAPDGTPRFQSTREIRECIARANQHGENLSWGQ